MFNYSKLSVYGTGLIGTPIHETSHLLMCLVFFHKVNAVKFFQINDEDGVLGYVNHSWNPRNIYQQIGNYFIGVAPIAVGTLIIYFGMQYFLPNTFSQISTYFKEFSFLPSDGIMNIFGNVFTLFGGMMKSMFAEFSIGWKWWVFMLVSLCIAIHMSLSGADIKGSLVAIPLMIVLLLAVNLVLGLIPFGIYDDFLGVMSFGSSFLLCTLILSLVLSVLCLAAGIIIKVVILILRKIFRR